MAQQFWQQWWSRARAFWRPASAPNGMASADWAALRLNTLGRTLLGLLVAWVLGWGVVALNRTSAQPDRQADAAQQIQVIRAAWVAASGASTFPI